MVSPSNYFKFDFTLAKLGTYDGKYMPEIKQMGEDMLNKEKARIENVIKIILDEMYLAPPHQ